MTQQVDHPPITDRNYTLDLYSGAVLGSTKIVGMGGASIAVAEGSAYMSANPAAAAVRPATSNDTWDWDWHLDWLNPDLGSDLDNNGSTTHVSRTLLLTGGLLGQWHSWGLGLTATFRRDVVQAGTGGQADPTVMVGALVLARSFWDDALTLGLSLRVGAFSIGEFANDQRTRTLFELSGATFQAGALWRPPESNLRVGLSAALPVAGQTPSVTGCDPMNCDGFILPNQVEVPWEIAAGVAWRVGATPWNRKITARWRDERELVLAADVVVSGPVENGDGIAAFLNQQLQPSGRSASVSVRGGAEFEWVPGWLRVRAGSYWEPARFSDVSGRVHGTAGLDVRLFSFGLWNQPYRARLSLALDLAERYGNGALSLGFWH
ncbi:MAG TPA: hypothetical protein VKN99_11580 [Polyangia bacterium]|nr:hypothetical protein [Polyangia bacterium]